jgi:hypothetical protein
VRKVRGPILDKLYAELKRCGDLSCTGQALHRAPQRPGPGHRPVNRAYGARFLGPLPRGDVVQDCVERRRRFEAEQVDVTIVTPARPDDRWRAILPMGVLPDDGTTLGARSLCDLMDKLDVLYQSGG